MANVPTGSLIFIASALAAAKAVTAVSNAAEAVCTSAAHGYQPGDLLLINSGWSRADARVFRVKSINAPDGFTLEGLDTTSLVQFPVGQGIGKARKIAEQTRIPSIISMSNSGGEPKNVNYRFMDADQEFSINDGFSAVVWTVELDADILGTVGYTALQALTDSQAESALIVVTRSGARLLQPCKVALNDSVKFQDGQINKISCTFNGSAKLTRYAS